MATSQSTGPFGPREYTYEQLAEAAHHFSNKYLLGQGGFGQVYEGSLHGEKFAIKKLRFPPDEQTKKGLDEIHVISSVRHRNLVKLLGYCVDRSNNVLLVLEYFRNKSLKVNLHEKEEILDWQKRRKIAIGSAKGLEYLHDHCSPTIIHQDIKPDNILLDDNFEPKIADFGLARIFTDHNTHISMSQVGTEIYMDPECSGKVTDKVDVYSFGVVLLELITGRKPKYQGNIVTWAGSQIKKALGGEFKDFVDFKLQKYDKEEMKRMVHCAAFCVYKRPKFRPPMRKPLLQELGSQKPQILRFIQEHQDDFLRFINQPVEGGEGNIIDLEQLQAAMTRMGVPSAAGAVPINFFRNDPQFQAFRARVQASPHLLDGGQRNILALGQPQPAMPQMVIVTPEEREAMRYDRAAASNPVRRCRRPPSVWGISI
ncbi:hypothetical protein P3X46_002570 [Hevea brasiliensis]|uniref:non-specific serine/threonine protein kinase n=1 Tax=Hevea brasiliensis TaxID=3981 RepID=A0ABQ9N8C9_HEVBR|nr:hypothetical protein P3X46_002570 [Hevea brasiliensis]